MSSPINLGPCGEDFNTFLDRWIKLETVEKRIGKFAANIIGKEVLEITPWEEGVRADLEDRLTIETELQANDTVSKARAIFLENNPAFAAKLFPKAPSSPDSFLLFFDNEYTDADIADLMQKIRSVEATYFKTSDGTIIPMSNVFLPEYFQHVHYTKEIPCEVDFSDETFGRFMGLQHFSLQGAPISVSEYVDLLRFVDFIRAERTEQKLLNALLAENIFTSENRDFLLLELLRLVLLKNAPITTTTAHLIIAFRKELPKASPITQNIIRRELEAANLSLDREYAVEERREIEPPKHEINKENLEAFYEALFPIPKSARAASSFMDAMRRAPEALQREYRKELETLAKDFKDKVTPNITYHLALLYLEGIGGLKNEVRAVHMLKQLKDYEPARQALEKIPLIKPSRVVLLSQVLPEIADFPEAVVAVNSSDGWLFDVHRAFLPKHDAFKSNPTNLEVGDGETFQLFFDYQQGRGIRVDLSLDELHGLYEFANHYGAKDCLTVVSDLIRKNNVSFIIPRDMLLRKLFDLFLLEQAPVDYEKGIVPFLSEELLKANPHTQKAFFEEVNSHPKTPMQQNALGFCYEHGCGIEKDPEKAVHHYTEAGNACALAQYNLGSLSPDPQIAYRFFKRAADSRLPPALLETGRSFLKYDSITGWNCIKSAADLGNREACYEWGNHTHEDGYYNEARMYLKKAADQGSIDALYRLGTSYLEGLQSNEDLGVMYLKEADELGNLDATAKLVLFYEKGEEDMAAAFPYAKKLADLGNVQAQFGIGQWYEAGKGVEKDLQQAFDYYSRADKQGHDDAKFAVAGFYREGLGRPKNPAKAKEYAEYFFAKANACQNPDEKRELLDKAADLGLSEALFPAGMAFLNAFDEAPAIRYLMQAANEGHEEASAIIEEHQTSCLQQATSHQTQANFLAATANLQAAARWGSPEGAYRLGLAYLDGSLGLDQDEEQAIAYIQQAADQGHLPALAKLNELLN